MSSVVGTTLMFTLISAIRESRIFTRTRVDIGCSGRVKLRWGIFVEGVVFVTTCTVASASMRGYFHLDRVF